MFERRMLDVGSWMLVGLADSSRCLRRQPVLTNIQHPTSGSVMLRREFLAGAVALALRRDRLDAAASLIERATSSGSVSAAALHVRQGSTELSRAFGRVPGPETPFLLASITKPMTATAVMILCDRKALALADSERKFIPEFSGGDRD